MGVLCLCCVSCNDPPGPVGSGILPNDNLFIATLNSDTVPMLAESSVGQVIPKLTDVLALPTPTNPAFLGACTAHDMPSSQIIAIAFLSFSPLSVSEEERQQLYGDIQPEDIRSAFLLLSPGRSILGDSIAQFSPFRVHTLRRAWYTENSLHTINLSDPNLIGSQIGIYRNTLSDSPIIDASQNLSRKLPIPLTDKQFIIRWLKANRTTWQHVDGLALVPIAELSRTIYELTDNARIVVRIKRPTDSVESSIVFDQFAHASIVYAPLPHNGSHDALIVQGGAALRTVVSFDLSRLPSFAAIHRSELRLPVDRKRSTISSAGLPRRIELYAEDNEGFPRALRPLESRRNVLNPPSATGLFDSTCSCYIFQGVPTIATISLNTVIENIIKSGGKKRLVLQLRSEIVTPQPSGQPIISRGEEEQTLSRIVFYGLREPDTTLRPRLTLTYSRRYAIPR
ncbi:MAG: hypothetical protein NZ661_04960 [Candidatus Kapabacteria bacterium]|nr:hypothetical protein [Candidatus Kapabacteria bacterium]